jgi:precorrin-4/cobalt-precorrin-4 C11-methyltransferase
MSGRVAFVGCGPGAADLMTLRAARLIARADIVVWGRPLLEETAVREHARPDAELIAWPPATQRDVEAAYDRARDEGLLVARLKSGDPALLGELAVDLAAVRERGLEHEIVPGVSAVGAAAAALGVELAATGPLVVAAPQRDGDETVTMLMAGRDPAAVAAAFAGRGLAPDAPCAIVHRVTWPGQLVAHCPLAELAETLADLALDGLTLVLSGSGVRVACYEVPE